MAKRLKLTSVSSTENKTKLLISVDSILLNHTTITSAKLRSSKGLSYCLQSTLWDFTNAGFLTLKLGLSDIPTGIDTYTLIIITNTYSTGYAWDTQLEITQLP